MRIGPAVDPSRAASVARSVWASYHDAEPAGAIGGELFKSVYREGKFLVLSESAPAAPAASVDTRTFEITRDYTMYDRTEAPQEYPPIVRSLASLTASQSVYPLILRSLREQASRRTRPEKGNTASWFETAQGRLLTTRVL